MIISRESRELVERTRLRIGLLQDSRDMRPDEAALLLYALGVVVGSAVEREQHQPPKKTEG